jgi:hypothetical protein
MNVVDELAKELLIYLDENATSKELTAFAALCRRVRACVLSGDPLEPPFGALQEKANAVYRASRDGGCSLAEVERALRTLEDMARIRATSRSARLSGEIQTASIFEAQIERAYTSLPVEFRW